MTENCDDAFFWQWFKSENLQKQVLKLQEGGVRLYFYYDKLCMGEIKIPSKSEQQKIGALLSHVDSLIQAMTKKLESLKAVKKSLLQKCFPKPGEKVPEMRFAGFSGDWEEKKLGEIAEKIMVGIANSATYAYADKGIVMFRNQNIKPNYLDEDDLIYLQSSFELTYKNKRLKENDVLVARTGYPGTACVVPKKYENSQTFTTLILRLNQDILDPYYVTQYLNSPIGISYFTSTQIGGGQKNSGASILSDMPFRYPSITEQQKIGQFFSKYDSLISAQQKEIDKLKDIKKSLLQKMFV
jgi:type I restriction enzyme S subunit